ncbi:MAG: Ig-like domain-containing protein [Myxococcota bacterium]|nr:Ig-like domain-containing protein [Myxococcota bacterium]
MLSLLLLSCTGDSTDSAQPFVFAAPTSHPALRGPGGPAVSFTEDELWTNCASLPGGETDAKHHNLVVPYRGHLMMPWVPEWSIFGGVSFFDVSDPCSPVLVGEGTHDRLRESHSLGFVHLPASDPHAGDYMAATGLHGIQIWDVTDETAPEMLSYLEIEGILYPDAYARVVLSVFWQYPWLYVAAADNGLMIVNAEDPANPELVASYPIEPALRAGGVFVMGNLMMVSSAEGSEAVLLDVSTPDAPQPIGGGRFLTVDGAGEAKETYHANTAGNYALFARKEGGGGVMVMDISDPSAPKYLADSVSEGNGGYVFYDEGFAFVGESSFATVYDLRNLPEITEVGRGDLPGDLDTFTPYGNVAILSVDDDAEDDIASAVMPWSTEPDLTGPSVLRIVPEDGATGVATTTRIGIAFDEMIEPSSVFPGSIQLTDEGGVAIEGWGSGQENIASYSPKDKLEPGTTYTLSVMADGVLDINSNPTEETVTTTFTTAGP